MKKKNIILKEKKPMVQWTLLKKSKYPLVNRYDEEIDLVNDEEIDLVNDEEIDLVNDDNNRYLHISYIVNGDGND